MNVMADRAQTTPSLPGQVVLVFQGGGALGAYQGGVYQALHEAGIEPNWVIGTSIGAVNGAIIAGNEPGKRPNEVSKFWGRMERKPIWGQGPLALIGGNVAAQMMTIFGGIAGYFMPNRDLAWGLHAPVGVERAGFYTIEALHETLNSVVDFSLINSGQPRLTVGAVNVRSGRMHYFDSRNMPITLKHVLASGALPPAFPAVCIDGDPYWDGGIYSNTPIEVVLDERPRRNSLIFSVNMWQPRGSEPKTIWQVLGRQKDIQYASRGKSHVARQEQIHRLRHVIRELTKHIPEARRDDPMVRELTAYGCSTVMHFVQFLSPQL